MHCPNTHVEKKLVGLSKCTLKCVWLVEDCSPCVFVSPLLLCGCWYVGLLLLKNTSQNSIKEKTEEQSGRTKWGRHQRPILSTVSTCCNIPVVTAGKPLYKQPAQILPAGCTHSKAFCSLGFVYWSAAWTAGQHEGDEVGRVRIERAQKLRAVIDTKWREERAIRLIKSGSCGVAAVWQKQTRAWSWRILPWKLDQLYVNSVFLGSYSEIGQRLIVYQHCSNDVCGSLCQQPSGGHSLDIWNNTGRALCVFRYMQSVCCPTSR